MKTPSPKISKAYIEGFVEGRLGTIVPKCPHASASAAEWRRGLLRGQAVKAFQDETKPSAADVSAELDKIKATTGIKK